MKKIVSFMLAAIIISTMCFVVNAQSDTTAIDEIKQSADILVTVDETAPSEEDETQEHSVNPPVEDWSKYTDVNEKVDYYYILNDGMATIVFVEAFYGRAYVIGEVDGYPVEAIAEGAYAGVSLESVTEIPESIKTIGAGAFGESYITTLIIHSSLESIGKDAFAKSEIDSLWFIGTESEFENIDIAEGNEPLFNAEFCDKYKVSSLIRQYGFEYFGLGIIEAMQYNLLILAAPISILIMPPAGIAALVAPVMSIPTFFIALFESISLFFKSFSVL